MPPAVRDRLEVLTEGEVQRLLLAASERAPTGVRNRALVAFLYCSGVRLGEAVALRPDELDLAARRTNVRGRLARSAHVFPAALPYLETWLAVRAELAVPSAAHLFCTLAGAALEPAYVRAMLARLARRAGLRRRVHAHLLRHSCAARLARSGLAIEALARQLGQGLRSARRALAPFGLEAAHGGVSRVEDCPWSLAPEPGQVRALCSIGPRSALPRARPPRGTIVVKLWRPPEL